MQNLYKKVLKCNSENNFAGCHGFKDYIQSQPSNSGTFRCYVNNLGDNFNYKVVPNGNSNRNRITSVSEVSKTGVTTPPNMIGLFRVSNLFNTGNQTPQGGFISSGIQSFVDTGSRITQSFTDGVSRVSSGVSNIFRSPFQFRRNSNARSIDENQIN